MPEMNGIELAEKIKQIKPNIKILYASGFADDRFLKQDSKNMNRYFIQKPYTLFSISQKILEVLGKDSD